MATATSVERRGFVVQVSEAALDAATDEQWTRFANLLRTYRSIVGVSVTLGGGGLPKDWLYVIWAYDQEREVHMGIDPKGDAST